MHFIITCRQAPLSGTFRTCFVNGNALTATCVLMCTFTLCVCADVQPAGPMTPTALALLGNRLANPGKFGRPSPGGGLGLDPGASPFLPRAASGAGAEGAKGMGTGAGAGVPTTRVSVDYNRLESAFLIISAMVLMAGMVFERWGAS